MNKLSLKIVTPSRIMYDGEAEMVIMRTKVGDIGIMAVDVYPLVFVEVGADILFRKVAHIRERQPREGAEQVEVAVQFLFGVFQFPLHQQADLIFGQETACCFLLLDFILAASVYLENDLEMLQRMRKFMVTIR